MTRNFLVMLVAAVVLPGYSMADEPAKLDLVLKCESDDGRYSQIVNLREDSFNTWDAAKGVFSREACNAEVPFFRKPSESETGAITEGIKASCEITPTLFKYEYRYYKHGCEPVLEYFLDEERWPFPEDTRLKIYERSKCPKERTVRGFSVDRTTGRFRWVEGLAGPDGSIKTDLVGNCELTPRPKLPATKF
jgi:hypothetical protein